MARSGKCTADDFGALREEFIPNDRRRGLAESGKGFDGMGIKCAGGLGGMSLFWGVAGREPSRNDRLRKVTLREDSDANVDVDALRSEAIEDALQAVLDDDGRRASTMPKRVCNANLRLVEDDVSDREGIC